MGAYSPNIFANSFISIAEHNPDGEVIIFGDRRITWGELVPRIFRIAQALIKLGVRRGDKVGLMFHNTPEFIEANYGIQAAGAVPTPMNYRFTPREIEYQGNHCDARVFLFDSIWAEAVGPAMANLTNIEHFICRGDSGLNQVMDYEDFVASGDDSDPAVANDWSDVAVMIYTGGTTGFPKGVMLTYQGHLDMYASATAAITVSSMTMDLPPERVKQMLDALPIPGKRALGWLVRTSAFKNFIKRPSVYEYLRKSNYEKHANPDVAAKGYGNVNKGMGPSMPFFHDAAYGGLVANALLGTSCFVMPDSVGFDPSLILELAEREKVGTLSNVPTGWRKLVTHEDVQKFDLSSVRMATTGGGACPAALKKQILAMLPNAMIFDGFGQTEMTPLTSFRIDADPDKISDRSVGKPFVETRVIGEDGKDLPQGETGELLYRSNTIMKGYYKDEEKTEEAMEDGWFRSGDLGYFDEGGEIRIVDRKNECINTGGEKVFPLEVEETLLSHPKVAEACVIGVPDEEWGSTVRAVIQLKPGEAADAHEIADFCRSDLAGYKIPRTVLFVDELPFSPAGKMLRQKVRDSYGDAD
jgi:acyl-CoA synthetase (AMP-forming)/AMP-acid ligase II